MHRTGGRLFPHMCGHRTGKRSSPRVDRTDPCSSALKPRHHDHGRPPRSRNIIHHERYTHYRTACKNYPHHKDTAPFNTVHGRVTATAGDDHTRTCILIDSKGYFWYHGYCVSTTHNVRTCNNTLPVRHKDATRNNPMSGSTKDKPE